MVHKMNRQLILYCRIERCHNIHLLNLVGIGLSPGIVLPGGVVGGIDFGIHIL